MHRLPDDVRLTQKEYFLLDESRGNLEYWAGRIVLLENNTERHGQLIINLGIALSSRLPRTCRQMTNVGVRAGHRVHIVKPDLMVVCGEREYYNKRDDVLVNPKMVVEVLSSSTANYDQVEKLKLYRAVRSIEEYLLVSQTEPLILRYPRKSGTLWTPERIVGLNATLKLSAFQTEVPLAEIYRDIDFPVANR